MREPRWCQRIGAALGAGVLLAGLSVGLTGQPTPARPAAARPGVAAPSGDRDVIADLFEWNWPSVASECTTVLGPAGYGAVQVAPPQDSLSRDGHPWWEVYQPADYDVNSRMGDRSAFADMVATCHAAGVKVYADAVVNHMTGQGSTSYGGKSFGKYDYPGIYSAADFHYYPDDCPEADDQIHDYDNATEVQHCELVGLSDLRTESDYVRDRLAGYLNDLLSIGVDGFRIDAAKHIPPADLAAIESRLSRSAYIYQEVSAGGAVTPGQYESTGDLLEFTYADKLTQQFNGDIANLRTFGQSWGMEPPDRSVVFVANHDTERDGSTLNYKAGAKFTLAHVFSLAWGYGTPKVYSGFDFAASDDSPPSNGSGYVTDTACGSGWECTDRWTPVRNMVGFHNTTRGAAVANWWDDGSNAIAFSRGGKGWVAVNNEGAAVDRTFTTGLPAGVYCDLIHGSVSGGGCTGPTVTVDASGNATTTVPANDAVAIDVDSVVDGGSTATVSVSFTETATTSWGQNVYLVGSIPALGGWSPEHAVALSSADYPNWTATVSLPAGTAFEYKYLKKNPDGSVTWESDPNRRYTTGTANASVHDTWR